MLNLKNYEVVAQAITLLLHPYGEVVIHDLKTGTIAAIYNNFSKRKVGDESLLEELTGSDLPNVFPLYTKINWDGRKMKSSTATLRDDRGTPIALLCINLDIARWEEFRHLLNQWLDMGQDQEQPQLLFKDDWKEKINFYVSEYMKQNNVTLKMLSKEEKSNLVIALYKEGAFKAKHAATYVADVLELSRTTIYNYLRGINENS